MQNIFVPEQQDVGEVEHRGRGEVHPGQVAPVDPGEVDEAREAEAAAEGPDVAQVRGRPARRGREVAVRRRRVVPLLIGRSSNLNDLWAQNVKGKIPGECSSQPGQARQPRPG